MNWGYKCALGCIALLVGAAIAWVLWWWCGVLLAAYILMFGYMIEMADKLMKEEEK